MPKILIVEDEPNMIVGLRDSFEYEGFEVFTAQDGEEGLEKARGLDPNIILLDVMLPLMSGVDVCRKLREEGDDVPIIMLTARSQEIDKVVGLEIGADDYVTKPFGIKELVARTRANLRRANNQVSKIENFKFGNIEIDFKKYTALKNKRKLELSSREFELLKFLINRQDEIVSRDQLLDEVWGYSANPITRTVDNHIAKLRQKIEINPADPKHIVTVHRVGYRFIS